MLAMPFVNDPDYLQNRIIGRCLTMSSSFSCCCKQLMAISAKQHKLEKGMGSGAECEAVCCAKERTLADCVGPECPEARGFCWRSRMESVVIKAADCTQERLTPECQ
jgi:hypothetical protein